MFELQRIFVPIDFSRTSRAALGMARAWSERAQARLHVAHVVPPMLRYMEQTLFPYASLGEDRVAIEAELLDNAREALERYHRLSELAFEDPRKPPRKGNEVEHRLEVIATGRRASAREALGERLEASDAELTIMGFSGESGQQAGSIGTTALHLLQSSPRPVLLARDLPGAGFRRVAVALDLSTHAQATLQAALEAALVHDAALDIIVVAPEPLNYDVRGIVSGALKVDAKRLERTVKRDALKLLERFTAEVEVPFPWKDAMGKLKVDQTVLIGDPAETIVGRVADTEADLLVVGVHGERRAQLARRLGRTAYALAANAPCHTLFIP